MLPRSRVVHFRSGARFETPILVPSFSSRGFALLDDGTSDVKIPLEMHAPMIADAILVSAYDLSFGLIPGVEGLNTVPRQGVLGNPEALFIDSGGYEIHKGPGSDLNRYALEPHGWGESEYRALLEKINPEGDIVIINLEIRDTPKSQMETASALFDSYPHLVHDFLLKPSKDALFLGLSTLRDIASDLAAFNIVGVTEKELGSSLADRLTAIATLRMTMDEAGVDIPIHVFGSLDPLLSVIYWLAGAEIFDGLTWITMAYDPDLYLTIYADALPIREGDWTQHEMRRHGDVWANNLTVRERVIMHMKEFLVSDSYDVFGPQANRISESVTVLQSRLQGRLR
jgi:hypothetical protein